MSKSFIAYVSTPSLISGIGCPTGVWMEKVERPNDELVSGTESLTLKTTPDGARWLPTYCQEADEPIWLDTHAAKKQSRP